jgi:hypothetical protein
VLLVAVLWMPQLACDGPDEIFLPGLVVFGSVTTESEEPVIAAVLPVEPLRIVPTTVSSWILRGHP